MNQHCHLPEFEAERSCDRRVVDLIDPADFEEMVTEPKVPICLRPRSYAK
jgi:hypothetical protein